MFSETRELRLRDLRYSRLLSRVGSLINRRFGAAYRAHIQGSRCPRFNVATNQQTHINVYRYLFVSLPYQTSLMHGHGLFKTVQDLIYKERLIIFNNNKYVLTNTNYISNPAPGLTFRNRASYI